MSPTQPTPVDVAVFARSPVISVRPVVLTAPGRGADLQVRVTAPTTGADVPIVVFSHGFGESMDSYAPLAEFWASQGFAVIQPTHLDSTTLSIAPEDPRTAAIWRFRIEDLTRVLDNVDVIEASLPGLDGRLNHDRIAVAGHSWGATTASALLGARIIDKDSNVGEDMSDRRVVAGVLLAVAGVGGENLTPFAAEHFSFMNPDFGQMATPALLVAGDQDQSPLALRGPDWWTDAYTQSPGDKSLLTLFGSEHTMGGIAGFSSHEITDWSLERIALIQRVTTAYLRSALDPNDDAWPQTSEALAHKHRLGEVKSK